MTSYIDDVINFVLQKRNLLEYPLKLFGYPPKIIASVPPIKFYYTTHQFSLSPPIYLLNSINHYLGKSSIFVYICATYLK